MKIAAFLATSILSLTALDAQAAAPTDVYSVTVKFADLNLDSKAGIVTLYHRIKGAAQRVCREQASERLVSKHTYAVCIDLAASTAVARINRPMLSDYLAQQSGKRVADAPPRVAVR
jgi:UrcA family protein